MPDSLQTFGELAKHHSKVQYSLFTLVVSLGSLGSAAQDEVAGLIRREADDLVGAAEELRTWVNRVVDEAGET